MNGIHAVLMSMLLAMQAAPKATERAPDEPLKKAAGLRGVLCHPDVGMERCKELAGSCDATELERQLRQSNLYGQFDPSTGTLTVEPPAPRG